MVLDHLVVEKMDSTSLDKSEVSSILRYGVEALFGINNDSEDIDKKIKYDSVSVDKLLDRSTLLKADVESKTNVEQSDSKTSFSFARVWILEENAQASEIEALAQIMPDNDGQGPIETRPIVVEQEQVDDVTFWDDVIEKTNLEHVNLDETFDRSDRRRKPVNYNETYLFVSPNAKRQKMQNAVELNNLDPVADMDWKPQEAADSSAESVVSDGDMYQDDTGIKVPRLPPSGPFRASLAEKNINPKIHPIYSAPLSSNHQVVDTSKMPSCLLCLDDSYHTLFACPDINNATLIQSRLDSFNNNHSRSKLDDQIFRYRKEIMVRLLTKCNQH
jgi:hypothetical protein